MASELIALVLSGALFASAAGAILSSKVSNSLISLFYTSVFLGIAFTVYGDGLLGLLTMVTFAGAISVLLLTVVLMTGESKLDFGGRRLAVAAIPLAAGVAGISALLLFTGQAVGTSADSSLSVLSFLWTLRPWDLLILIVASAGAMATIVSLLGGED